MVDWGRLGDGLVDGAGHVLDKGKEFAGEVVDTGTDMLGAGLDKVGAHGWADGVEDWGDETASSLGAEVGEKQLGQSEEADELIHGRPEKIAATVKNLRDFQRAFDLVGGGMKKLDSGHWKGEAADAFRRAFETLPTDWLRAADAFEDAARALETYARTVTSAQGKAREAIALYKEGKQDYERAAAEFQRKAEAYNAVRNTDHPLPHPGKFSDPGLAKRQLAHDLLQQARQIRNEAAETAKGAVTAAMAHAPKEPTGLNRLKGEVYDHALGQGIELAHFSGGIVKGGAGLINFLRSMSPTDPYNLTHPADYYKGVNMTLAGLVSTGANPDRALKNAWDSAKSDPTEFIGRVVPEMVGTKGAGVVRGGAGAGLRHAAKHSITEGAESAAQKAARNDPPKTSRPQDAVESKGTDPIDIATGVMYLPQTDIALPGTLPLIFRRRVASDYRAGRWFGPSWSSTADQRLEVDSQGIVFVCEDGLLLSYPHPAPGVPVMPSHGPRWPLDLDASGDYTITDPDSGRVRHFSPHAADVALLVQIDDRNGNWIQFEYDETGVPTGIVHGAGYHLKLTVNEDRITALHLAGAAPDGSDQEIFRYCYTGGHLTEVINSSGLPFRFAYDDRGRVTSWTDTNDSRYEYAYDDGDRCIAEGGAAGHMALRLDYDGIGPESGMRVTTVTSSSGAVHRYIVNDDYQVVTEIDPLGAITRFERDRYNRLLSRTDQLGRINRFEYDELGQLISAVRPDGREISAQYNDLRLPARVTNPDRTVVHHEYDERGNRIAVTDPSGAVTCTTYDEDGHATSVTDALGNVTCIRSNAAGLPLELTDPLGATTYITRDAFGRPVTLTDPLGVVTRLEWTVEGRLSRRTDADGTTQSWNYDGEGNCLTHTDAMGAVSRFEYTHFDLMTARTGPDGVRYEFAYDRELRLTQVLNPQGLTWNYTYDPAGHLICETDFDNRTLTYERDRAGRLTARINALGQTIRFERDELDRIVSKNAAGSVTTFAYDFSDQLAEAVNADATITYLRDRYGRLQSETVNGRTMTYQYDRLGRRIGRTTPSSAVSTWTYDSAGRRNSLTTSGRILTFEHDAAGYETARHIGGSVSLTSRFDKTGRLTTQQIDGAGCSIQRRDYTYRADGHLTGLTDQLSGTKSFDLDAAGRVTSVQAAGWSERYAYDEVGNQTEASWPTTHPGKEATGSREYSGTTIIRAGDVRYEHDALGRVTLRQKSRLSRKPDTWRFEWDAEDRMRSATTPDGVVWRYQYDALGRRTAKQRLSEDKQTVLEQVSFTWDGPTLCEQTTRTDALSNTVVLTWYHDGLRPVTQQERILAPCPSQKVIDERFFAIITDLVGGPSELVDEYGVLAWRTRSTLWGATSWSIDSTAYTPLRFPGQYFDFETDLHYNFHRYYDPETARYLTSDPLGLAPAPNPAGYVSNPHAWIDPYGLFGCPEEDHLFRGTTRGYGASDGTQASGFTPTSTDPGVATLFARHSEQFGEGIVQLFPRSALDGVPLERGVIRAEAEIAVGLPASQLSRLASVEIPSGAAAKILEGMGIHVPKVHSIGGITDALEWDVPKLSPEQISKFVAEAYKHGRT
ncbi:putative T7SS-secreted protein [Streptomyces sp. NPDC127118]|uniref:putative T7SS-secreted protein n=1 Tax=Streptomyces sp. NPDC127118 TaxID=3345369 RepID=UPI003637C737